MELTNDERAARDFAVRAHGDQKYGSHPYSFHLDEVHAIAVEFGLPMEYRIGAFLHDVLEDTTEEAKNLQSAFGPIVTKHVWSVSGMGPNRKARIEDAHVRMTEHPGGIPLKLCDRLGNGRRSKADNAGLFAMYQREYPHFKAKLEPLSRASGVDCTPMWAALDRLFVL